MFIKLIIFLLGFSSCNSQCYEIIEVKIIRYDAGNLENNRVNKDYVISEKAIDYDSINRRHFYSSKFSYSENHFGVQVIERATNRRFVNRKSEGFVEQSRYQDNPFLPEIEPTGKKKKIGKYNCEEYLITNGYGPDLIYYISMEHPFIYLYHRPLQFPGFVVSRQTYFGEDKVSEVIYDIRKVSCNEKFKSSIKLVEELLKK